VLFNVPVRTLPVIALMGAAGGATKIILMQYGVNIVLASLSGAILTGCLSIFSAHIKHIPPPVFAIPAVIPMVPGTLAYRMILGLVKLAADKPDQAYTQVLSETINNGLKVTFILMSLALGVAIPMLITRKESAKHITFRKKDNVT
jgi:uncharacterized membrane protein YjjB (DUF3815 family)